MKITAIGVNAAFSTGDYQDCVSVEKASALFLKLYQDADSKQLSEADIRSQLQAISELRYQPRWHSNFLLEFDMPNKRGGETYRLLVDAGGDIRHALKAIDLTSADIDGVYISHPHADHIGGMEYLALTTLFNPYYTPNKKAWLGEQFIAEKLFLEQNLWTIPPASAKPDLFVHKKVLEPLKRAVGPGMDTVQGVPDVTIDTYFDVHTVGKQEDGTTTTHFFKDGEGRWKMTPIFAMHVISSSEEMPSYGISLEYSNGYTVLMPTDTQHMIPQQLVSHYRKADRIYMDCETSPFPTGVHPHISNLIHDMDADIQKKCLLYHYDQPPEIPDNMFYGILKAGDVHHYPD
ncbi:MBL fold metallo-hydrolase [Candidatus Venteria ishoeyi]|uniref:MBL fold metallo-hydrolase n=1 Tax=Candidatus Venteria ishoeyi TaxID=1899563 RepID=UPI0025A5868C|nr:MBL fold metallo-hydrolase [Candidatus Venteria ishoeyi]MDM8546722.1 MBL fold metallo-hydrolase [Candidatus Venteria ishoeyi]